LLPGDKDNQVGHLIIQALAFSLTADYDRLHAFYRQVGKVKSADEFFLGRNLLVAGNTFAQFSGRSLGLVLVVRVSRAAVILHFDW